MGRVPWKSTFSQFWPHSSRVGRVAAGAGLALAATAGGLAFTAGSASAATAVTARATAPAGATAPVRAAAPVRGDATWVARPAIAAQAARPAMAGTARAASAAQPPDPALAQRVAAWVVGGGEAELNALGRDFKALETDASAQNLPAMGTDCKQLGTDVAAAQAYAPIPDTAAQTAWAAALAQYAHGATDCMTGATTQDYTRITKAAAEIEAGSTDLDKVTARLNAIAG